MAIKLRIRKVILCFNRKQTSTHLRMNSCEQGSISPLIIAYFSIIMMTIFLISNVASAYISRRDLTNIVESALAISAQELDQFTYYYGAPITDYLTETSVNAKSARVPIDCSAAGSTFKEILLSESKFSKEENILNSAEVSGLWSFGGAIEIKSFACNGYEISATVKEIRNLPFQARIFGLTTFTNEVSVSTSSFLLNESD